LQLLHPRQWLQTCTPVDPQCPRKNTSIRPLSKREFGTVYVRVRESIETNLIRVERCAPDRHSLTVASQRWCVETARDTSNFGQVLRPSKQEKIAVRFTRTKLHCKHTSNLISDCLFVREL
jgi:hypothetical protein